VKGRKKGRKEQDGHDDDGISAAHSNRSLIFGSEKKQEQTQKMAKKNIFF
jgi:hypothetical protein